MAVLGGNGAGGGLDEAKAELCRLEGKLGVAQESLRAATKEARGALAPWQPSSSDISALGSLEEHLAELEVLVATEHYVEALLGLQQLLNRLEVSVRELAQITDDSSRFSERAALAVDACSAAAEHRLTLQPLLEQDGCPMPAAFVQFAAGVSERVQTALKSLRSRLSSAFEASLEAAGWPPALGSPSPAFTPEALKSLYELAGYLTEAQKAAEPQSFPPGIEALPVGDGAEDPQLWVAELLVEPLRQKLRFHFAGGRGSDRLDKPEWMFSHALRMAKEIAPKASMLDGALQACNLARPQPLSVAVANGIRGAVAGILASHVLPNLLELNQPPLWLHLVDEAIDFERQIAPLRGELDEDEEGLLGPPIWVGRSCLTALVDDKRSMAALERAELLEAQRLMDEATDGDEAWLPSGGEWDGGSTAWKSEFWPPRVAEASLAVLKGLLHRSSCFPGQGAASTFCSHVFAPAAANLMAVMVRLGQRAENYKDLSSDVWAPKVAGLCCAAHYLEHNLREAADTFLPGADPRTSPAHKTADDLSTLRRKWTLKLAQAVTQKFVTAAGAYRASIAVFADERRVEPGVQMEASRAWKPAMQQLQEAMAKLATLLDAVVFREMWRAVAVGINQILYNDIATEAQFSSWGARQFAADCDALVSVFGLYTSRPNAHFKELREASNLLVLEEEELAHLESAIDDEPDAAKAMLESLGVRNLTLEQAESILAQRL